MVTLRTCTAGVWECGRFGRTIAGVGGWGSGYGPRVHTGIVTPLPPPPSLPTTNSGGTTVLSSQLFHHFHVLTTTTYLLPPHYPPGENSSVLCVRVYARVLVCVLVGMCVGVRPHHLSGPEGPSRIRSIYVYCIVLYSHCCRVPYSQRTPLHALSFIPNTNTSSLQLPMSTKLNRKWQQ